MRDPLFLRIDGQVINVHDIKWAGMKDNGTKKKVYVEFISGGFTTLSADIRFGDFEIALDHVLIAAGKN